MKFVLTNASDEKIYGPAPWARALRDACGLSGNKNIPVLPFALPGGNTLREVQEADLSRYEDLDDESASVSGDVWLVPAKDISLEDAKTAARAAVAAKRYAVEVGGLTWERPSDDDAFVIPTDRESQAKIAAERIAAEAELRANGDGIKCTRISDGVTAYYAMTDADILDLAVSARDHVNGVYKVEEQKRVLIENVGNLTALRNINLESGWPANP